MRSNRESSNSGMVGIGAGGCGSRETQAPCHLSLYVPQITYMSFAASVVKMNDSMTAIESDDQHYRADQLAACHSLLDPARRGRRQDVLASTMVAILAGRGELTVLRLFAAVRRIWRTDAIADAVLERALVDARAASLVTLQTDLEGNETLRVSAGATAETEQDQLYVAHLLGRFTDGVSERISAYPDAARLSAKTERITNLVIAAVACACDGSYAVDSPGSSPWARPDHVSTKPVSVYAASVQPKSLREPVKQLALDALDPTDPFGNQIVHLVVVSSLLHGLATQRGAGEVPPLEQMRLLLDTSALIGLAFSDDDPSYRLIFELITLSLRCGAEIVVAEHTLAEWERVWAAADAEEAGQRRRITMGLSPRLARLVNNPFLAAYSVYRHEGGSDSWIRWQIGRRDIRQWLKDMDVQIQEHHNVDQSDIDCHGAVRNKLIELSNDPDIYRSRSDSAADADANSAAMIARWRSNRGENSALFIAHDRLTSQAYSEVYPCSQPLAANPVAWLLYVSNLIADTPSTVVDIADFIADLAVRNTLLELASNYSLEEALDISEIFARESIELSAREARDLTDPALFDALDTLQKEAGENVHTRAAAVLLRRATRNNQRAAQREEIQSTELEAVRSDARERISEESERATQFQKDARTERQRAVDAESDREELKLTNVRLRRKLMALITSAVAIVFLVTLTSWGLLGGSGILIGSAGAVLGTLYAWRWIDDPETPTARLWAGFTSQVILNIVLAIVF